MIVTAIVALVFIGVIGYNLYNQYMDSRYWEDHHDENLALSEQPPSLIYDDDINSRNAKLNFISIYQTIYDEETKDFTDKVALEAVEQLHVELNQITDDDYKTAYNDRFQLIGDKWHIEQMHRDLFDDPEQKTTLKKTVTPQDVIAVNAETYDQLHQYAIDSQNTDAFATRLYDVQTKLMDDALVLDQQALTLSQWLNEEEGVWTVQPDLYPAQFEEYVQSLEESDLHYTWHGTAKLKEIVQKVHPITEAYAARHQKYNAIESDKERQELAFEEVDQSLATAQANLQRTLENIDTERVSLETEIQTLKDRQVALRDDMNAIDDDIAQAQRNREDMRDENARLAEEAEREAERRRNEQAESRENQETARSESSESESSSRPSESNGAGDNNTSEENTSSSDTEEENYLQSPNTTDVRDEKYDALIGQDASDVLDNMTENYTYQRRDGVELSDETAHISGYTIKENGEVHFYVE